MPEKEPSLDQKLDPKDSERTVLGDLRAAADYFDAEIDDSWVENGLQELRDRGITTYAQSLTDIQEKYPRMPLSRQSLMAQMQLEVVPDQVETEDFWEEMSQYYSDTPTPAYELWGSSLERLAEDLGLPLEQAAAKADEDMVDMFNDMLRAQLKMHSAELQTAFEELDQDDPSIVINETQHGFAQDSTWLQQSRQELYQAYKLRDTMRPVWQPYVDKVFDEVQRGEHVIALSGPYGIGKTSVFMHLLQEKLEAIGTQMIEPVDTRDLYDQTSLPDIEGRAVAIIDEAQTFADEDPDNTYGYHKPREHALFMEYARKMLDANKQLVLVVPGSSRSLRREYVKQSAPLLNTEILHSVEIGTLHIPEEPLQMILQGLGKDDEFIDLVSSQPLLTGPRAFENLMNQTSSSIGVNAIRTREQLQNFLREWIRGRGDAAFMSVDMNGVPHNPLEANYGSTSEAIQLYETLGEPIPDPSRLHYIQVGDPMNRG